MRQLNIAKNNHLVISRNEQKHVIRIPGIVIVGYGVLDDIAKILDELEASKVIIFYGHTTREIAGRFVEELLSEERIEFGSFIVEKASYDVVEKAKRFAAAQSPDAIISIGGGKNIDVGKIVARHLGKHLISVPTSASHDGIASPFATIKDRGTKHSTLATPPTAVIADLDIIKRAPRRFLLAGVGDIIANLNAVQDWLLAHRLRGEYFGENASMLSKMSAELILKNKDAIEVMDDDGVRVLVESLINSGVAMGIAGSSRPASGAEHMFSHALDLVAEKPALHGEQCGVGTIMMLYLRGDDRWVEIRQFLMDIGAPTNYKDLGVKEEEIINALTIAHSIRPERYTILGEKGLTRKAAIKLAKETRVIDGVSL